MLFVLFKQIKEKRVLLDGWTGEGTFPKGPWNTNLYVRARIKLFDHYIPSFKSFGIIRLQLSASFLLALIYSHEPFSFLFLSPFRRSSAIGLSWGGKLNAATIEVYRRSSLFLLKISVGSWALLKGLLHGKNKL